MHFGMLYQGKSGNLAKNLISKKTFDEQLEIALKLAYYYILKSVGPLKHYIQFYNTGFSWNLQKGREKKTF
jgi:hypothetical protein